MEQITASSLNEIHYKIMELIKAFPAGDALDFPAGPGRLSAWLREQGFNVTAADIYPDSFKPKNIPIRRADLDAIFPFKDNAFDYAFFIEGPEHVENTYHAFREFARVLKPQGKLIISYPNYSNLESRFRTIFYGVVEPIECKTEAVKNNGHITRLPFVLLKMALHRAGFKIMRVANGKTKKNQLFFLPLYLLIKLFTLVKGEKGDNKYWLRDSNAFDVIMGGNSLILICECNK